MKLEAFHKDDAINVAPKLHSVIFEDDSVRVLKVTVTAGSHADMHWHPHNINYVLSGGTLKFTKQDGSSMNVTLESGQVTSAQHDVYHAVDNEGEDLVETIQVEFKSFS